MLRRLRAEDVDALVALHGDKRVNRFVSTYSHQQALERLASDKQQWTERGHGLFAVELKSSGEFIGRVGLNYWEILGEVELGWILKAEAWGHGYATEAAGACLEWGFATLDADHFIAMIGHGNTASVRVAERLGFTPLRKDVLFGHPCTVYSVDQLA
ncbi:GNAT family N-acetyltransferase [Streptomyces morookaense]|uniref:GNAT family N-acetyltransferase n=1 Tax=Streptomyces morookaense TaxID=1970 RepID=UPI00159E60FA|nr:GNAT family N-acetyltransferase [Streptomyces morookaense]